MRPARRSGDSLVWLTGAALALCLLMIGGMVALIVHHGAGVFWAGDLVRLHLDDGTRVLGEVVARQRIPGEEERYRLQLKVGNRDLYGLDFRWVEEARITAQDRPAEAVVLERAEWGPFVGFLAGVYGGDREVAPGTAEGRQALERHLRAAALQRRQIRRLEQGEIGALGRQLARTELALRRAAGEGAAATALAELEARRQRLLTEHEAWSAHLDELRLASQGLTVAVRTVEGEGRRLPAAGILRAFWPNRLSVWGKGRLYLSRTWEFLSGQPRESNTEGGIFPAIFGTAAMVLLMSLAAVPFGVLAALYLREYARQGPLVRLTRIAVNNLAGVPSIVFGMFGLGFFVYGVGGSIDRLFYAGALPTPTFGTGGLLWASLTLALLTVPVVIVATEEALAAVPRAIREGSLALGSTRFQMIWSVVLPSALPGILTGVILATARGAGEVAPLMITGVVKLAPDLPVDGEWPFVHLERKFMHLGFHIYDVGFQSPNVEAARPMVYATALLLVLLVLVLNLAAILVRNRLRRRYAAPAF
ncbi:MAG: phosphate ABC transporter permease PstA [Candidatus Latescibacterota bacterium]